MENIIDLAKDLGYEVRNGIVLLPLEKCEDVEYGIVASYSSKPQVYVRRGEAVEFGDEIECYTFESIVRTLKIGDEFFVESKKKGGVDRLIGLMYAFKNPNIFVDYKLRTEILRKTLKLIPERHRIIENKIDEVEEKIKEIKNFSFLPDYDKILRNLNNELAELANIYFSTVSGEKREIEIEGDVSSVGEYMKDGSIKVVGNVGYVGPYMEDGSIKVVGNVSSVGWVMKGGKIEIEGDVSSVGPDISGGKIAIYGKVFSIEEGTGMVYIDFEKNPTYKISERLRPIEEYEEKVWKDIAGRI